MKSVPNEVDGIYLEEERSWCRGVVTTLASLKDLFEERGEGGGILLGALSGLFSLQSSSSGVVPSAVLMDSGERYKGDLTLSLFTQYKASNKLSKPVIDEEWKKSKEEVVLSHKSRAEFILEDILPRIELQGIPWFEAAVDFGFWDTEDATSKRFQEDFFLQPKDLALLSMHRHVRGFRGYFSPLSVIKENPEHVDAQVATRAVWDLLLAALGPGTGALSPYVFFGVRTFIQSFAGLGGIPCLASRQQPNSADSLFKAGVATNTKLRRAALASSLLELWGQKLRDE